MAAKRKISIRKVLQALVTLLVTSSCFVAIVGASGLQEKKTIGRILLHVNNEDKYLFIDKSALWKDVIERKHIKANKTRLENLDIKSIERSAALHPWVSKAEVFMDNGNNLHIVVDQRKPVARIFMENGQSKYLDTSLNLLPLSDEFTYYTTIVSNVPVLGNDSLSQGLKAQVVKLVGFIERDSFWNAQIQQIMVSPERKFELIPVLGTHKILIGDTSDLPEKFSNLFAFYKKVLNRIGWDKYEVLDVRFKGQVVASPSLPWKNPSKNAISNMDWVKNIVGNEPVDTGKTMQPVQAVKPEAAKATTQPKATVISLPQKPAAAAKPVPLRPAQAKLQAKAPVKQLSTLKPVSKDPKKAAGNAVDKVKDKKDEPQKAIKAKTVVNNKPQQEKKGVEETKQNKQPAKYIYQGNTNH